MNGHIVHTSATVETPQITATNYFSNAVHDEAMARVRYMVSHGHRLGLLLGGTGSGKSTVLQVLALELAQHGHLTVLCPLLGRENIEFVSAVAVGLGHFPDTSDTCPQLWRSISDRLRENKYQQRSVVVLVDDADEAEMDVLTSITRLVQTDASLTSRFTVIASAHAARCQLLGPRLRDLCELRVELDAWGQFEIARYVQQHLKSRPPFDEGALRTLWQLTGGVPRRVVQLAELSILAGSDRDAIVAETVEAAFHELSLQDPDYSS